MTEYIKKAYVEQCMNDSFRNSGIPAEARKKFQKWLDKAPAADVRPVVRGKWLPDYDYAEYDFDGSTPLLEPIKFQDGWQCSLCGHYMPSEENFCPNCGAQMEES